MEEEKQGEGGGDTNSMVWGEGGGARRKTIRTRRSVFTTEAEESAVASCVLNHVARKPRRVSKMPRRTGTMFRPGPVIGGRGEEGWAYTLGATTNVKLAVASRVTSTLISPAATKACTPHAGRGDDRYARRRVHRQDAGARRTELP